jgi:catechol 2,3-dioxygenase-like lactoylglutathione lyase family enzyme
MKIALTSILVDDQAKALAFYTDKLGFVKHADIPMGEARWLTVVSPEGAPGMEVVLEPAGHPAAGPYRSALYADGIPATSFESADIHAEHARLVERGVAFRSPPKNLGPVTIAVFDDTCGNLIQLHQPT